MEKSDDLVIFGLTSDVQYSHEPDGKCWTTGRSRYYSSSLNGLKASLGVMKNRKPAVSFVVHAGDLMDIQCSLKGYTHAVIDEIQSLIDASGLPFYHAIGNHDLYNLQKKDLLKTKLYTGALCDKGDCVGYYEVVLNARYSLVVLDAYDLALIGYEKGDEKLVQSKHYFRENGKNDPDAFKNFNGGVGSAQMEWLEKTLQACDEKGRNVILLSK